MSDHEDTLLRRSALIFAPEKRLTRSVLMEAINIHDTPPWASIVITAGHLAQLADFPAKDVSYEQDDSYRGVKVRVFGVWRVVVRPREWFKGEALKEESHEGR